MKTIVAATGLLLGILNYANAAEPVCYYVSVHLFRLSAPAMGKMEPASVTLIDSDAGGGPSQSTRFSSFSAADLTIGKTVFHMDAKGCTLNGGPQANGKLGDEVECLTRPQICVEAGQSGRITVGADFPVEYMEPATDGLFARKMQQCSGGLTVELTVGRDASGGIAVSPLKIQIVSWRGEREPVAGSSLDIGKPVLDKAVISMSARCKPKQPVGILWTPGRSGSSSQPAVYPSIVPETPADGGLLMVLTVSQVDVQPAGAAAKASQ